jgi:hypothetical protein
MGETSPQSEIKRRCISERPLWELQILQQNVWFVTYGKYLSPMGSRQQTFVIYGEYLSPMGSKQQKTGNHRINACHRFKVEQTFTSTSTAGYQMPSMSKNVTCTGFSPQGEKWNRLFKRRGGGDKSWHTSWSRFSGRSCWSKGYTPRGNYGLWIGRHLRPLWNHLEVLHRKVFTKQEVNMISSQCTNTKDSKLSLTRRIAQLPALKHCVLTLQ